MARQEISASYESKSEDVMQRAFKIPKRKRTFNSSISRRTLRNDNGARRNFSNLHHGAPSGADVKTEGSSMTSATADSEVPGREVRPWALLPPTPGSKAYSGTKVAFFGMAAPAAAAGEGRGGGAAMEGAAGAEGRANARGGAVGAAGEARTMGRSVPTTGAGWGVGSGRSGNGVMLEELREVSEELEGGKGCTMTSSLPDSTEETIELKVSEGEDRLVPLVVPGKQCFTNKS